MERILLIADNQELQQRIAKLFESAGYLLLSTSNGKKGVEWAREIRPVAIFFELAIPEINGYEVLEILQNDPKTNRIPFIFITAKADRTAFRKAMECGADDYLTTPFTDRELLKTLEVRLKKVRLFGSKSEGNAENIQPLGQEDNPLISLLIESSAEKRYKQKQLVFAEGKHPQYLFYLKSGKVKASKINEDGKELTVGLYSPGDYMGYIALLEDKPYKVTTRALEASNIMRIPRKNFFELMNRHSDLPLQFIQVLVQNNNIKAEQMVHLAYNSLRKRVASSLIRLKNKFSLDPKEEVLLKMTREELARLSGTTTESLIRTLSDFKNEKLIQIEGRAIRILDEDGLKNMLN